MIEPRPSSPFFVRGDCHHGYDEKGKKGRTRKNAETTGSAKWKKISSDGGARKRDKSSGVRATKDRGEGTKG